MLSPLLTATIRFYQFFVSPFLGANCRYMPTCSQYAIEAIDLYGPLKGSVLTVRRLCRCHPWGGHGYDPVPKRLENGYNRTLRRYTWLNQSACRAWNVPFRASPQAIRPAF